MLHSLHLEPNHKMVRLEMVGATVQLVRPRACYRARQQQPMYEQQFVCARYQRVIATRSAQKLRRLAMKVFERATTLYSL